MDNKSAIYKYEQLIISHGDSFNLSGTREEKEANALTIIRYIITDLLEWTPQEALEHIDAEYAKAYHMDLLSKYIIRDAEIIRDEDYDYMIYKAFSKDLHYDPTSKILRMYQSLMDGEISKFPKGYFSKNNGGNLRATVLLSHAIEKADGPEFHDELELYKLFANTPLANRKLEEWKLSNACRNIYNSKPLDYLYATMGPDPDSTLLYDAFSFNKIFQKVYNELRNEERALKAQEEAAEKPAVETKTKKKAAAKTAKAAKQAKTDKPAKKKKR